ncbi:hypothetical protein [Cellulomonas triticagri]|uniref:DUF4911 domain-containing protein n=1 Tax=Cellulomonas triticagri TaxID=2483352 RepID=A0A3M2JPK2_9CELL|nr:hypothetical protein [Cellulomonas triticagri]RMI14276.1 hypothetical protein EBM89_00495 [Cellulomonas triticagri]
MLYHIRVRGPLSDYAALREYADIVAAPTGDGAMLSCQVPDAAGLAGVVALLTDLRLEITELRVVQDAT